MRTILSVFLAILNFLLGSWFCLFPSPGGLGPSMEKEPALAAFAQGGITLTLDEANGLYSITQDGRLLLQNAFFAVELDSEIILPQCYGTHTASREGDTVFFTHTDGDFPTLTQRFEFHDGYLLTDAAMEDIETNWFAPVYTADAASLRGGTQMLRVPFDNDDWSSIQPAWLLAGDDRSYELTALLNQVDQSAVVIGSVTHDTWKTGIGWRGEAGAVKSFCVFGGAADYNTRDTQPHGMVSGGTVVSPTIFIGAYNDWREGLNAFGDANAAVAPPLTWKGGAPLGWNSWGVLQANLSSEAAYAVSDYIKEELQPIWQREGDTVFVNLDSFWDYAFHNSDAELCAFVEHCEANGQKAGIYYTPFAYWGSAQSLEGNPLYDALLRGADGGILPTWDGALAFDVTHPLVEQRIRTAIQRFLDMGFAYLKMDFIGHGAMEGKHYDNSVQTGIQAYNLAMGRIVDQIDGRMFINLAMSPTFPYQYAHGRRLACDTFYGIGDTKYLLNSLTYGFWQARLYACPDPDHIVVWGKNGTALPGAARARVTSGIITGSFLAGDDFSNPAGNSTKARKRFDDALKNPDIMALAHKSEIFLPAQLSLGNGEVSANVYVLREGGTAYIAVFNFSLLPLPFELNLPELTGLTGQVQLKELWSGKTDKASGCYTAWVGGGDAKVFCVTK